MRPRPIPIEGVGAIAVIDAIHLAVPSEYGGPQPRGVSQWPLIDQLLVRVETEKGLVGWGESFGHLSCGATAAALVSMVAPLCIGTLPGDFGDLSARLQRALHSYGNDGPVRYAISGVEIALWDIAGKSKGVPVRSLLNPGSTASKVPAYASLLRYGDPEGVAAGAYDAVQRGHAAVKLHEADAKSVERARNSIGQDVLLSLDVNNRLSPEAAIALVRQIEPYSLQWIEEPCWPPSAGHLAQIAAAGNIAVAAGENAASLADLERIARDGMASYLQPSVSKLGGLESLLASLEIGAEYGAAIAPHSAYFGPGLAATIQFCAAFNIMAEWYDCRLQGNACGLVPENGQFVLSQGAGLGIEIDNDVIQEYRKDRRQRS